MNITQFTMEEVRCFGKRQILEIRPLTFLVGENSTGKTTTLACFHVLANYLRHRGRGFQSRPPIHSELSRTLLETVKRKRRLLSWGLLIITLMKMLNGQSDLLRKTVDLNPRLVQSQ